MNNIQQQIWHNTVARGVIPDIPLAQLNYKFFEKLQEEYFELLNSLHNGIFDETELADLFIVICNCATRNNIDIVQLALEKSANDRIRK